ncbi:MAG: hypothetical protein QXW70_03070 [Candidatus Anstonellales archaeon]
MEITYPALRDLQRSERESTNITPLPKDFYSKLSKFISEKKSLLTTTSTISEIREYENIYKTIKEIITMRQKKILFRALTSTEHDATGMTEEEHQLYDKIREAIKEETEEIEGVVFSTQEKQPTPSQTKYKKVQFVKDIPAYKGSELKSYGPFKKGDIQLLPEGEALFLISSKMANEIE